MHAIRLCERRRDVIGVLVWCLRREVQDLMHPLGEGEGLALLLELGGSELSSLLITLDGGGDGGVDESQNQLLITGEEVGTLLLALGYGGGNFGIVLLAIDRLVDGAVGKDGAAEGAAVVAREVVLCAIDADGLDAGGIGAEVGMLCVESFGAERAFGILWGGDLWCRCGYRLSRRHW